MNTRDGFNARKEAFATAITELAEFFVRRGYQDLLVRARDLRDKLVAEQFNLVVLGQFKRGKSTLINALLGADLLPTAVVPLTFIVTIIHYGPAPWALVSFLDGRTLEARGEPAASLRAGARGVLVARQGHDAFGLDAPEAPRARVGNPEHDRP
jgi:hypothetical protein